MADNAAATTETMLRDPGDGALPRPERYEILRKIGAGSQAELLLGTAHGAKGFRRHVVIKHAPSDLEDAARQIADLIQEALDHDNAGRPFLVMEYVDGEGWLVGTEESCSLTLGIANGDRSPSNPTHGREHNGAC